MPDQELCFTVDEMFSKYNKPDSPGFAVGLIRDGELLFTGGYGCANLDYGIPITPKTVFHVCSMAKQFTAACIALLEERGTLCCDEDIRVYLPELPRYRQTIRLKDLIHMTNGLYDIYSAAGFILGVRENDFFTEEQAWDFVKACDWTMFSPGEKYSYGNTGYFLMGQIVQRTTGKPLAQFADEEIFKPLGMKDTFFRDDRTKIIRNRAECYSDYAHVHYNDRTRPYCSRNDRLSANTDTMSLPGAGQLWTTVEDLFLWNRNFYDNRLGRGGPELIRKLTTPGVLNNGQESGYGYGLFIDNKNGLRHIYHGGWANGYSCQMLQIPDRRVSVICLGNHTSFFEEIEVWRGGISKVDRLAALLLGKETTEPAEPVKPEMYCIESTFPNLYGFYQDPESSWIWEVKHGTKGLTVVQNYSSEFHLTQTAQDTFTGPNGLEYRVGRTENRDVFCFSTVKDGKEHIYYRFLNRPLTPEEAVVYAGEYLCPRMSVTYRVCPERDGLRLTNIDHHNTAVNFLYKPTIRDSFIAQYPPYVNWYCISFQRDNTDQVVSLTYRDDEGSGRENLVFSKL